MTNPMMQRLRGERKDGISAEETMQWAADEIQRLERIESAAKAVRDAVMASRAHTDWLDSLAKLAGTLEGGAVHGVASDYDDLARKWEEAKQAMTGENHNEIPPLDTLDLYEEHDGLRAISPAKVMQIVEENGQLRADISQAYDLRDKAEGRYCTALREIERLRNVLNRARPWLVNSQPNVLVGTGGDKAELLGDLDRAISQSPNEPSVQILGFSGPPCSCGRPNDPNTQHRTNGPCIGLPPHPFTENQR